MFGTCRICKRKPRLIEMQEPLFDRATAYLLRCTACLKKGLRIETEPVTATPDKYDVAMSILATRWKGGSKGKSKPCS